MIKKPLKVAKFLKMTCQSDTLDPHILPDTLINIVPQPLELYFSSLANQKNFEGQFLAFPSCSNWEKDIHLKSQKYPSLSLTLSGRSVCKQVLMNISPTSVPSERAFSMAGFFLSKLRGSMNYWTTLNNPDSLKTKNWQKYFFSGKILFFGEKGTLIFEFSAKFVNKNMERSILYQTNHP